MKHVKTIKEATLLIAVAAIALGMILTLRPEATDRTLRRLLGGMLAAQGIVKLFSYFSKDQFGLAYQFDFALGIFSLTAALFMLLYPETAAAAPTLVLGTSFFIDGIFKLQTAQDARRFGLARWWVILTLAVVTCACGLFLLLQPLREAAMTTGMGAALAVYGVQNLCIIIYTVRVKKAQQ